MILPDTLSIVDVPQPVNGESVEPTQLVRYDAMCRAIDNAYSVDEVKDIRDKALAFEAYAKQAKNTEAERQACEIRLRAEDRGGKLLQVMERAEAGRPKMGDSTVANSEYQEAIKRAGLGERQAQRWQQFSDVPDEVKEAAYAAPEKPSRKAIVDKVGSKQEPMDPDALWLWGRLRDFEQKHILDRDPDNVLAAMTDAMRADTLRLSGRVAEWLKGIADDQ